MPSLSSKAFFALLLLLSSSVQRAYSIPVHSTTLNAIGVKPKHDLHAIGGALRHDSNVGAGPYMQTVSQSIDDSNTLERRVLSHGDHASGSDSESESDTGHGHHNNAPAPAAQHQQQPQAAANHGQQPQQAHAAAPVYNAAANHHGPPAHHQRPAAQYIPMPAVNPNAPLPRPNFNRPPVGLAIGLPPPQGPYQMPPQYPQDRPIQLAPMGNPQGPNVPPAHHQPGHPQYIPPPTPMQIPHQQFVPNLGVGLGGFGAPNLPVPQQGGLGPNQPYPQGYNPAQQYYPLQNNNGGGYNPAQQYYNGGGYNPAQQYYPPQNNNGGGSSSSQRHPSSSRRF